MSATSAKPAFAAQSAPRAQSGARSVSAACALCLGAVMALLSPAFADRPAADDGSISTLAGYAARIDPSYHWREASSGRIADTEYVELILTSQTWRGIPWKHQLFVLRPSRMSADSRQALLFIHGGRWKREYEAERSQADLPREARLFAELAETLRSPIGVLRQVPHQPLFERREDALIAYTFDRYLKTGESDWPLLLPMVKSAVSGMDAMQELADQRWGARIESFTVCGASKRGWTSWLTAAVDARVTAVAPMVIDVLNMMAQIEHQKATWGELSDEIHDYSDIDLPQRLRSESGRALLSIVDPYSYRHQLAQPKLILLATNDRYWPLDALKLYWSGLPDPKHVLYFPNQGHGFRDYQRLIGSISAFHRYAARGEPLPDFSWAFSRDPRYLALSVRSERAPERVRAWSARSPSRDFRASRWVSRSCEGTRGRYLCRTALADASYTAMFVELSFKDRREPRFSLSTTVCIAPPKSESVALDC